MKVFAAAFPFLIVATAFGAQVQALHEPMVAIRPHETSIHLQGFHRPSDCCTQYTPRKIRCGSMKDYYETSSGCSQPGVMVPLRRCSVNDLLHLYDETSFSASLFCHQADTCPLYRTEMSHLTVS
uniref:C-C motif chemokine 15-like isoform X1 n=1 Tax=Panthera onca TaxID=9690 RepID=UPI002953C37F|nr:C-C motif chemokine 15-like isoform X1 [Panthera onca]